MLALNQPLNSTKLSMSKKYKNKTCVYCMAANSSEDGDHVVSREFFLPEKRAGLPKVPACKACNNAKARLEHYLTAVMPFGGRHADSSRNLSTLVPPRLAKNTKLFAALKQGMKSGIARLSGGLWVRAMTVPIDSERLIQLFELIARGLAYWHWGIYLPANTCVVKAAFLTSPGRAMFEKLLAQNAKNRIKENLGDGVFIYEGAQSAECPELTVWRMSLYGVVVGNDPRSPTERCSEAYCLTALKRMPA
jgi:hypothetical protein